MPLRFRLLLLVLLAGGSFAPGARAQLSDAAQISLITVLPGDEVYSIFGHSAFRVYDPAQGLDVTYNYGTFDFGNPVVFGAKFAYGDLDYRLSRYSYPVAVEVYRDYERRAIIEQVLNLDAAQRNALFRFLETNLLPENRYYRYDFLFDNCSTRLRDVLKATLGDAVTFSPPPPGKTFRQMLNPYLVEKPFLDLGIDLVLGAPLDRLATGWEAMFLPLDLMAAFDQASIAVDGAPQPLVTRRDTVAWIEESARAEAAPPWPAFLFWALFALGAAATLQEARRGRERRGPDVLLLGLVGTAGLLIAFEWFVSQHGVTADNWNLLWAWPTHLGAAVLLARGVRGTWLRRYLAAAGLVTLGVLLGWAFWPQDLHEALLPLLLLLALRSLWQAYRLRPSEHVMREA